MASSPIHIEQNELYACEPKHIKTLEHLLNAWLPLKQKCWLAHKLFSKICTDFELQKVNSYHDTRAKRLQNVIETLLVSPLLKVAETNIEKKTLTIKLCQWLIKYATSDQWLMMLQRRLTKALFNVNLNIERQIEVTLESTNTITLRQAFEVYSIDSPQSKLIFEGKSNIIFQLANPTEITTSVIANATLFDEALHHAFITPPLDEQVNKYIHQKKLDLPIEEIDILQSGRNYYLDKITAQELQQHFISTNIYSAEFKNSNGYELLKAIFTEKPIQGLEL